MPRGGVKPSPSASGETFAWVIEAGWLPAPDIKYLAGFEGDGDMLLLNWSADPFKAIRFARKGDAEIIAKSFVDRDDSPHAWRAAEHGFIEKSAPDQSATADSRDVEILWLRSSLVTLMMLAAANPSPLTNEQVAAICKVTLDKAMDLATARKPAPDATEKGAE